MAIGAVGAIMAFRGLQGVANWPAMGGGPALAQIQSDANVEPFVRERARTSLRHSADGSAVAQAGVIAAAEARFAGISTPNGQIWLQRAEADLRRGLAMAPADGFAWLRLASVEYLLKGPAPATMAAFRMSSYNLRYDNGAIPLVLAMSAQLWPNMDADARAFAIAVVQRSWSTDILREKLTPLALSANGREIMLAYLRPQDKVQAWIDKKIEAALAERRERELRPPQ